ncbi:hypothetical protein V5P93_005735 [Actinokineospora auranticolor]|uniref:hypothetical protein n=1 Tax=Actinokineospora auranticolor TaxID=155976 RepID=UPI0011B03FC9|nr:hypothetical protein [Actinokineospora auranticolor]
MSDGARVDWRRALGWHKASYEPGIGFTVGEFVRNPDYVDDRAAPARSDQAPSPDTPTTTRANSPPRLPLASPAPPRSTPAEHPVPARLGNHRPSDHDAARHRNHDAAPTGRDRTHRAGLGDRIGRLDDPRLDSLRPHLRATRAGMSAFAPSACAADGGARGAHHDDRYTAGRVPGIPGRFLVDIHGSPDAARIGDTALTPRELADLIRANPDYGGSPVTLLGCGTGTTRDGFAARLAVELGVRVTAPDGDAWAAHDGNLFAATRARDPDAPLTWPPDGSWNTFSPTGATIVHKGPYPPGHRPAWGLCAPVDTGRRATYTPDFWAPGTTADILQQMVDVGVRAVWANFNYENRAFQQWCQSADPGPLPPLCPEIRMNCWEMVMYAAIVSGELTRAQAQEIYRFENSAAGREAWTRRLTGLLGGAERRRYRRGGPPPRRGQIVFWNGISHVGMATGRMRGGSPEVYTFWPPPTNLAEFVNKKKPGRAGLLGHATDDYVKTSTIDALRAYMLDPDGEVKAAEVVVEYSDPKWLERDEHR